MTLTPHVPNNALLLHVCKKAFIRCSLSCNEESSHILLCLSCQQVKTMLRAEVQGDVGKRAVDHGGFPSGYHFLGQLIHITTSWSSLLENLLGDERNKRAVLWLDEY